jgi:YHS domain-containing protein
MASVLYFLVWAGLFFLMMRFGCGAHVMGHGHHHGKGSTEPPGTSPDAAGKWVAPDKDVDPVCHMTVDTAKAKTTVHEGHVYHFCSQDCRGKFEAEPSKYLNANLVPQKQ